MNENDKTVHLAPPKRIEYAVITVLIVLAVFLAIETIGALNAMNNPTTPPANTITVSGAGTASVAPDIANITFSVLQTGSSVSEAQSAATTKTNAALAAVKNLGVADADVSTQSYEVMPQYAQTNPCGPGMLCPQYMPPTSQRIVGYQVSETISVKVRNLDKTGDILQALGSLGVQNISGPNFALDNPDAGTDAARADAISKAKQEAQTLASQLGVHLGKIVSFSENGGGMPYPVVYAKGMATADSVAPAPQLPTGQNEYSSSVSITYQIW